MSRRTKVIIAVVVLVVVAGAVAAVALGAGGRAPVVEVATVEREDLSITVSASGKVDAGVKSDVYPPTAGTLESIDVADGQEVAAGDTLAQMDTAPLELQEEQARAGLAQAQAQLQAARQQAPSAADKRAAAANTKAAKAAYDAARDGYDAAKSVYDSLPGTLQASAEASLTQAAIARDQAYAAYLGAKAQEEQVNESVNCQIRAAQAAVDQAEEALAVASDNVEAATMKAPIDGIVLFNPLGTPGADGEIPKASAGVAVAPQAAPFTVVQLQTLRFTAEVDEVDVDKVEPGMKAVVSLDAFPGEELETTVIEVRSAAQQTPTGGTVFPVYLGLTGLAQNVLLGMKGDADVMVRGVEAAVTIPIEALFDEDDEKFVYIVESDALERRDVVTGVLTDTEAEILDGLAPGETVALSGAVELQDGMAVRVEK